MYPPEIVSAGSSLGGS